ncbi:hypothetical protein FXN63_18765 [Pigmentiphaga aceris]|uniref:Type III secretion system chaperone n=1 Tax=Pigmentiphaga aceris TaxID=1940612 RepID=A0A5C0AYW5_9BURK|nr:CesT family type III secretion system chaperone [Pigmentiphaga aceris]QEI07652.1 hypothetical protein FXN63_18765 [Pigmentiphaga aceris]
MSFRDSINQWLAGLDAPAGVNLVLDEAGALGLALADGKVLTLEVEEDSGMVHMHVGLQRLPNDGTRALVIEEALALNLFTRATQGATLGLDRGSDSLILSLSRDIASLDHTGFATLLAAFAETAEDLQARLNEVGAPGKSAAPAPSTASVPPVPQPFFNDHTDPRFLA